MCKAARPSGGVEPSNQCRCRGGRLCHHDDGVWKVVCDFCAVSQLVTFQSGSWFVKNVRQHNLKMRLKVLLCALHWLAPYLHLSRWPIPPMDASWNNIRGMWSGSTRRCPPRRKWTSSGRRWRSTRRVQMTGNPRHLTSLPFSYHLQRVVIAS
jgi:hypothetical protein